MAFISEKSIAEVEAASNIVDVVSRYLSLKQTGANYKTLCPFHSEKTPSFTVSPAKNMFYCFGCGQGGGVFQFIMKMENISYPEAVKLQAERLGIKLVLDYTQVKDVDAEKSSRLKEALQLLNNAVCKFYNQQLQHPDLGKKAKAYLKERGILQETTETFKLGYAPDSWDTLLSHLKKQNYADSILKNSGLFLERQRASGFYDRFRDGLIFPLFDPYGKVIGFNSRDLSGSTEAPKYQNISETPLYQKGRQLYGLNLSNSAIREKKEAILVEGNFDLITTYQSGIKNVVASLGTALTSAHARLMKRYADKVIFVYDADTAGTKATIRGFEICLEAGLQVFAAVLPVGKDPDTFIKQESSEAFQNLVSKPKMFVDFIIDIALQDFPAQNTENKIKALQQILPTIAKIPNPSLRKSYLRPIVLKLKIEEDLVLQELTNSLKMGSTRLTDSKLKPLKGLPPTEEKRIRMMISNEDLAKLILSEIVPEDFSNSDLRTIFEAFQTLNQQNLKLETNNVLKLLSQEEHRNLFAWLCIIPDDLMLTNNEAQYSFICSEIPRLKKQIEQLKKKITELEEKGENNIENADYVNLMKKLQQVNSQRSINEIAFRYIGFKNP